MTDWIYRHRIVSTLFALVALFLVVYATLRVFGVVTEVTGPVAAAYGSLLGFPAVAVGLYRWRREKDGQEGQRNG